jgi:hypothetical protein
MSVRDGEDFEFTALAGDGNCAKLHCFPAAVRRVIRCRIAKATPAASRPGRWGVLNDPNPASTLDLVAG